MKSLKRVLCALLCLALGAALMLPVGATEQKPNTPVITKQPTFGFPVRVGQSFTLEVEACLPEGSNGVLSCEWYELGSEADSDSSPAAIGAKAVIPVTSGLYQKHAGFVGATIKYCAVVTSTYTDANGVVQTIPVKSDPVAVTLAGNPFTPIAEMWKNVYSMISEDSAMMRIFELTLFALPVFFLSVVSLIGTSVVYLMTFAT